VDSKLKVIRHQSHQSPQSNQSHQPSTINHFSEQRTTNNEQRLRLRLRLSPMNFLDWTHKFPKFYTFVIDVV